MEFKKINIISKFKIEIELDDEYDSRLEVISIEDKKLDIFVNGIQRDLNKETEDTIREYISENIDQIELNRVIMNDDYNMIYSRLSTTDIIKGYKKKDTAYKKINDCLDYFISTEEYEKCTILQKHINNIKD